MKRIAAFVFAFFAVCYLQIAAADAQFRPHECRYGFCVPSGGPTATPVSNACINSSGTTITFTAQGTGTAKAGRISVVTINWSDSTAAGTAELTAVTIGGISMARQVRASGDDQNSNSEIWYVANPTGTTANIVATFSTAVDGVTIEVYSLVGYQSVVATTTGTASVSQGYNNKQLAIAAASRTVNVSTSLSNMTNNFSSACGASLWGVHASQKLSGNGGTLSSSINPTTNNPKIALAVWQVPAAATCTTNMAGTVLANWDASVTASLTLGAGSKVTNWADQSASGNNLGNGNVLNKPTYSATSFNGGRPGLALANASGSMTSSGTVAFGTGNTVTFYYVGTINSASSSNGRALAYWDGSGSDFSSVGSFIFFRPGTSQTMAMMRATVQPTATAITYDIPAIWIGTITSGGVMTLYTNGIAGSTATSGGNFISNGNFSVGASISDIVGVTGQLAEVAVSNGLTNSTNVTATYNCLKVKWGL